MNYRVSLIAIFLGFSCFSAFAQDNKGNKKNSETGEETAGQKRIGIARIQVFASPGKGFQINEVLANPPLFFGEKSDNLIYYKRKGYPPTTGDTIRDFTADSLAMYFKQDLTTMSGYDDAGGNRSRRRNYIHDLPTENPQKMAVDSIFDESVDIGCFWSFSKSEDKNSLIPSVQMKMEIYDRMGQAKFEKSVMLNPSDIKTSHFKESYGVEYDFVKGVNISELSDGGILGNVIADVYLQALNKLLDHKK
jgi:hypothetical protein